MRDVIYPGLGAPGSNICNFLRDQFGIRASMVGADIVVSERDAANAFPVTGVVKSHEQLELKPGNEDAIAQRMASRIAVAQPNLGRVEVKIVNDFGMLGEIAAARDFIAAVDPRDVAKELAAKVIPLLRRIGATHVTTLTTDMVRAQGVLSLTRIFCLSQKFGFQRAVELIKTGHGNREAEPLGSVLPAPTDLLSFVDALMRFPPVVLTLSVRRLDCSWQFQNKGMWVLPRPLCNGFLGEFSSELGPLAPPDLVSGLLGLRNMDEGNVWRYLNLVTRGVDRLFGWLGDPRNFQDDSGKVDLLRQLQAFSAVHLLFSDLVAMQFPVNAHSRISFAMSALDKLANLRVELGRATGPDRVAFERLCSADQGRELANVLDRVCQEQNYDELGQQLRGSVTRIYSELHEQIARQGGGYAGSEQARVERLWSQRNVRHGSFLRGQQFETLFLEAAGRAPRTLPSLPFILSLGLICDPGSFVTYDPQIST